MFKIFPFLILSIVVCSCADTPPLVKNELQNTTFDVNGKSDFTFVNQSKDTIAFYLVNWYRLPSDYIEFKQKIAPNESFSLELKSQGFNYLEFDFADSSYKFFTAPNAGHSFYKLSDTSYFTGDFDTINNYWKPLGGNHYRNLETSMNLINLTQREHYSYQDLMSKNDEVIQKATQQLLTTGNELPNWYIQLESDRLKILGAQYKLNSLLYRKRLLNYQDEIPHDFVYQIMRNVPIENEHLLGFDNMNHLLREYHQQSIWPMNDSAKGHNPNLGDSIIVFMDTNLSPNISDFALATYLNFKLQVSPEFSVAKWIDLIDNLELKNVVLEQASKNEALPEGAKAPIIIGINPDSSVFNSSQLTDSIVLLNFWASYCKPCINKFELENALVEHFKNKPVKIVNICIESDWNHFTALIDIHQLKTANVFIDSKLLKQTKEAFGIHSLPHSVLIDKNGRVLKNKCDVDKGEISIEIDKL